MVAESEQGDLFEAVVAGNCERARLILATGVSPNRFDGNGRTPLIIAIREAGAYAQPQRRPGFFGRFFVRAQPDSRHETTNEMVQMLLDSGARHDLSGFEDWTPLMHAARAGRARACEALFSAGVNADTRNFKGRTALMIAAYYLQEVVLGLLIEHGTDHNQVDADGRSALDFLELRVRDRSKAKRCRRLLRRAGVKYGSHGPGALARFLAAVPLLGQLLSVFRTLGRVARHFTRDELSQSRQPPLENRALVVIGVLVSLVSVYLVGTQFWWAPAAAGTYCLLFAFPSILQLPYLLFSPAPRRKRASAKQPERGETRTTSLVTPDAVSNFMRLGWTTLSAKIRTRDARLRHVLRHASSIGLASGVVLCVLWLAPSYLLVLPIPDPKSPIGSGFGLTAVQALFPALVFVAALALEGRLRGGRLNAYQARKDRIASEINDELTEQTARQSSDGQAFVLYLRTFGVTGKLTLRGVDFESAVAYNLSPMLPVVALGQPGEALGAGRIATTDDRWKQEIRKLIDAATMIMLIPSHREGTLWEIARLKELDLFDKTVFSMPPEAAFDDDLYSDEWNRAVPVLAAMGLAVPRHYHKGLLFKLDADGELLAHAPMQAEEFLLELGLTSQQGDGNDSDEEFEEDGDGDSDGDGDGNGSDGEGGGDGGGSG